MWKTCNNPGLLCPDKRVLCAFKKQNNDFDGWDRFDCGLGWIWIGIHLAILHGTAIETNRAQFEWLAGKRAFGEGDPSKGECHGISTEGDYGDGVESETAGRRAIDPTIG